MAEQNENVEELETEVVEEGKSIPVEDMTADDALAVLLSAEPVRATKRVALEGRKGMGEVALVVRSLTDREIKDIRKQAEIPLSREAKRRGDEQEMDDDLYRRLVVAQGVQSPDLGDRELLSKHGCAAAHQLVGKLFLSGHITILFAKVMEVSGYSEDAVRDLGE